MEFIYRITLIDRLYVEENWTMEDEKIVEEHLQHLTELKNQNKLVLAGKTHGLSEDTFGIVIFSADSLDEATKIMNRDPGIKKSIMIGHLQQYDVAVFNSNFETK